MSGKTVRRTPCEMRAFQCGYCTPGMVVAAGALLHDNPHPTDADIVAALDGNLCRCGTYPRIIRAIQLAAERIAPGMSQVSRCTVGRSVWNDA